MRFFKSFFSLWRPIKDQHPHEITLIAYQTHKHKLQAESGVTSCLSSDVHQCYTAAALSRAFLEKPGHMPSLIQEGMLKHLLHTSWNFQDLPQTENLVRGATTWTNITLAIFQLLFLSIFLRGIWLALHLRR